METIRRKMERAICQAGTTAAERREIIEIGAVRGKILKITKIKAFGADATRLLKKRGMIIGKIITNVAWLPSFGFGTSAPRPAIILL